MRAKFRFQEDKIPQKIAVVIDAFTPGGAQRNLELIIPTWVELGIEVTLVLIQESREELSVSRLLKIGVRLERIGAKRMIDFKAFIRFLGIMKNYRNQLVISNLFWSQTWGALAKLRNPSIRLTWVEHNTYLKRTLTQWIIFWSLAKFANTIFGVSVEIMQFLKSKKIKHVSVINNAVASRGLSHNHRHQSKIILFVGRLNEQKNPMFALKVFEKLLSNVDKTTKYQLKVLGSGPLINEMRSYVLEGGIQRSVEFLGHVEAEQVALEMSGASVLLMTSLQEGSPLVRLEALEQGMCIVTTKTSGLLGILVDENTGEVKAPGIFIGDSLDELSKFLKKAFEANYWDTNAVSARMKLIASSSPEAVALRYLNKLESQAH